MADNFFRKYFKKSKWGIFLDALFIVVFALIIIPQTRIFITSNVIRVFSFGPSISEKSKDTPLSYEALNWEITNYKGEKITLSDLKGKYVFLNFWATWCPPCVGEMPSIQKLYNDYGNQVEFILLSNENKNTVSKFMDRKGYNLPTYTSYQNTPQDLNSTSIPITFIISPEGAIILKHKGAANWNDKSVRDLLDNK
ncbi:MAG: TlpA family protein disulfide reductase [Bacteroidales bacterium]